MSDVLYFEDGIAVAQPPVTTLGAVESGHGTVTIADGGTYCLAPLIELSNQLGLLGNIIIGAQFTSDKTQITLNWERQADDAPAQKELELASLKIAAQAAQLREKANHIRALEHMIAQGRLELFELPDLSEGEE